MHTSHTRSRFSRVGMAALLAATLALAWIATSSSVVRAASDGFVFDQTTTMSGFTSAESSILGLFSESTPGHINGASAVMEATSITELEPVVCRREFASALSEVAPQGNTGSLNAGVIFFVTATAVTSSCQAGAGSSAVALVDTAGTGEFHVPFGSGLDLTIETATATAPLSGSLLDFELRDIVADTVVYSITGSTGSGIVQFFTKATVGGRDLKWTVSSSASAVCGAPSCFQSESGAWEFTFGATAAVLTATPPFDTNPVGESHTVTATLTQDGSPLVGETIDFDITAGPHTGTVGSDATNTSGQATFTYTGTASGFDTISVDHVPSGKHFEVSKSWEEVLEAQATFVPPLPLSLPQLGPSPAAPSASGTVDFGNSFFSISKVCLISHFSQDDLFDPGEKIRYFDPLAIRHAGANYPISQGPIPRDHQQTCFLIIDYPSLMFDLFDGVADVGVYMQEGSVLLTAVKVQITGVPVPVGYRIDAGLRRTVDAGATLFHDIGVLDAGDLGSPPTVTMSATSMVPLSAVSFSPASGTPGFTSTLELSTSASTPTGVYWVVVTATGGGFTRSLNMQVEVLPPSTIPDFDGDGLPDATDPEPFGDPAIPIFSIDSGTPSGACICTPPMMNLQSGDLLPNNPTNVQNWYVKDDSVPGMDVTMNLTVVNLDEAGFHTIRIFDGGGTEVAFAIKVQYHSNINMPALDTVSVPLVVPPGAPDEVYRIELTVEGDPANPAVPGPTPGDPSTPGVEVVARHYDLKTQGASALGMPSPSLRQIEAAPAAWYINVAAGESVAVRVASIGLVAPAENALIELRDHTGAVVASTTISGAIPFDTALTALAATAGQWSVVVSGLDHHYWMDKLSGADRGIYATWLTFGAGNVVVNLEDVTGGSPVPFTGTVGVTLERTGPGPSAVLFTGNVSGPVFVSPPLPPGFYSVTVDPPFGFTVTPTVVQVTIRCKSTADTLFHLEGPSAPQVNARTIGFWKNHDELIGPLLPIGLGDGAVSTVDQAVEILKNSNARDARDALRAQLLATILNRKSGSAFDAAAPDIADIRPTVQLARAFLNTHGLPVTRKHQDRQEALDLKDLLDTYNNSGE